MNDPGTQLQSRAPDPIDLGLPLPWPAGTRFGIDGPADVNGDGEVLERGRTRIRLRLRLHNLPPDKDPGPEQPRDGNVDVTYDLEVQPNGRVRVRITNNDDGRRLTDDPNGTIEQDSDKIEVHFTDPDNGQHSLEMQPEDADEIDVDIDGHDYDLERR